MNNTPKSINIVIGANAGDEGKGNVTNLFCMKEEPVLGILTNGGPQRGHTAWNGKVRHVFGHFCAGTLTGAATWLAPSYMVNPMQFIREYEELLTIGTKPRVYIDPRCRFTTPWDMMLNQGSRQMDGTHHTCGMGIWETYQRYADTNALPIGDYLELTETEKVRYLVGIRDRALLRMKEEMSGSTVTKWLSTAKSRALLFRFMADIEDMCKMKAVLIGEEILHMYPHLVFENGQGLLLDWSDDEEEAVYTTPSRTGIFEADKLIERNFTGQTVQACYVTRTYLTRHGDGPLGFECHREELDPRIRETTNVTNPFQGHFRYGKMNTEALDARIRKDFAGHGQNNTWKLALAITHTDEYSPGEELLQASRTYDERYLIGGVGRTTVRN